MISTEYSDLKLCNPLKRVCLVLSISIVPMCSPNSSDSI